MSEGQELARLREEITALVADLPGPLSKVSARSEGTALEITWQRPVIRSGGAVEAPAAAAPAGQVVTVAVEPAPSPADGTKAVVAPLVGTFYRSPEPHARAFVQPGDEVIPGQTVAIIESMKLMNQIESEWAGVVAEVCVENGTAVEYGQPLIRIKTAS